MLRFYAISSHIHSFEMSGVSCLILSFSLQFDLHTIFETKFTLCILYTERVSTDVLSLRMYANINAVPSTLKFDLHWSNNADSNCVQNIYQCSMLKIVYESRIQFTFVPNGDLCDLVRWAISWLLCVHFFTMYVYVYPLCLH